MQKYVWIIVCAGMILSACMPGLPAPEPTASPTPVKAEVQTAQPSDTPQPTPTRSPEPSVTPVTASPTAAPVSLPTTSAILPSALVIDHTSIELFNQIPDEYISAAAELRLLFRHASVGKNITDGLDCLANNYAKRPFFCDKGIPTGMTVYDPKYDRSRWVFELHQPPPGINPPWQEKLNGFIRRVDGLSPDEFQIVGYKHGYVEAIPGAKIDDLFFQNIPDDQFPGIADLEALEKRHPELTILYFTMGLARVALPDSQNFNRQMRDYTAAHGKILVDLADIESHATDGSICTDSEGQSIEAICDEYTDEDVNGHLNALGSLRMAQAMWVLMAQLAGWKP